MQTISDIITYLTTNIKQTDIGLAPGASEQMIAKFERKIGVRLPDDIKAFYQFTNGFLSDEDQFRIVDIDEMLSNYKQKKKIYFAEYLTYCDMWELVIDKHDHNSYKIASGVLLTTSFSEFLSIFLSGGVFEKGGLYERKDDIIVDSIKSRPDAMVAKFKVDQIFRLTKRGLVIAGYIIEGEVAAFNVLLFNIEGKTKPFFIDSTEYVDTIDGSMTGLIWNFDHDIYDAEIKKTVGDTIAVYSFKRGA